MHYRYNRTIQLNWLDTGRTSGHRHIFMITYIICSFICCSDIVLCYICLLMLLYFIMRITIVTHDTCTTLNSHQHIVLSPGLVTHQMQSTLETSILDIQIRRDRATRGSDRRSAGVFHYLSVGYVYVGHCPVLFSWCYDMCMRLCVGSMLIFSYVLI